MARKKRTNPLLLAARTYLRLHAPDLQAAPLRLRMLDGPPGSPSCAVVAEVCQVAICPNGVLAAVAETMKNEIEQRRAIPPGSTPQAAAHTLVRDYEITGDIVIRILAQEARHPALTPLLDVGRKWHRRWVEATFAPSLSRLPAGERARRATQLVAVTDVYIWKLLRRDFNHGVAEVTALIAGMVQRLLEENPQ